LIASSECSQFIRTSRGEDEMTPKESRPDYKASVINMEKVLALEKAYREANKEKIKLGRSLQRATRRKKCSDKATAKQLGEDSALPYLPTRTQG
jgi:hypothetical protein